MPPDPVGGGGCCPAENARPRTRPRPRHDDDERTAIRSRRRADIRLRPAGRLLAASRRAPAGGGPRRPGDGSPAAAGRPGPWRCRRGGRAGGGSGVLGRRGGRGRSRGRGRGYGGGRGGSGGVRRRADLMRCLRVGGSLRPSTSLGRGTAGISCVLRRRGGRRRGGRRGGRGRSSRRSGGRGGWPRTAAGVASVAPMAFRRDRVMTGMGWVASAASGANPRCGAAARTARRSRSRRRTRRPVLARRSPAAGTGARLFGLGVLVWGLFSRVLRPGVGGRALRGPGSGLAAAAGRLAGRRGLGSPAASVCGRWPGPSGRSGPGRPRRGRGSSGRPSAARRGGRRAGGSTADGVLAGESAAGRDGAGLPDDRRGRRDSPCRAGAATAAGAGALVSA